MNSLNLEDATTGHEDTDSMDGTNLKEWNSGEMGAWGLKEEEEQEKDGTPTKIWPFPFTVVCGPWH